MHYFNVNNMYNRLLYNVYSHKAIFSSENSKLEELKKFSISHSLAKMSGSLCTLHEPTVFWRPARYKKIELTIEILREEGD